MASAVRKADEQINEEGYFALEKQTDMRHEYIDGEVYAMVGGSFNHGRITQNIARKIGNHLENNPCEVFAESTKVKIPQVFQRSDYVYPDVVVDCSTQKANDNALTTPVLVVEVLSKSTHYRDKVTKRHLYQQITTLQEYVLVEQDVAEVIVRRRKTNWLAEEFFLGDAVTFDSISLTLTVAEIYERVVNEEVTEWNAQKLSQTNDTEAGGVD